ncbi:hypothetical protein P168DRAFT_289203 [Aspergillus campestris IBT 28561]|uniref:Uncharacterized protein n=1 Tax=Aspergillus campestris (strain IBT 28561) TaxID=1392248 RepID=A0A2I1D7B1_ASPC2|nr:uncharacterized protein P168DRAFT_289203 [Aspergillus campestris IBT 28561]PKY05772.1 hypothetical protein P168DRAFT_289203 [Aspergillus campestris IBT 28561]
MVNYPPSETPITTIGLREICHFNGHTFKRLRGTQQWTETTTSHPSPSNNPPTTQSPPLYLSLVQHAQDDDEPLHWSLFIAYENQPGHEYQVTGDAEHMTYQPSKTHTDVVNSDWFLTLYNLAIITEEQSEAVKQVAESEQPPWANNRREVTENCQGWTVRVIARLVDIGIVPIEKLEMAKSMVEPV